MKEYEKPIILQMSFCYEDVLMVSIKDEVLDYNKGADEIWD